ncbi:hypothetical protein JKP88DRAFT_274677 [Tribonema minus]|uniref:Uncharacterized protein n=1 Tax=Tribonema minus TaxID=303371 RepID=A0A835ZKR8_9STRA|nr:hypothetical protein JKP88DRAFT_274677 [Tribonema minus]
MSFAALRLLKENAIWWNNTDSKKDTLHNCNMSDIDVMMLLSLKEINQHVITLDSQLEGHSRAPMLITDARDMVVNNYKPCACARHRHLQRLKDPEACELLQKNYGRCIQIC